MRETPEPDLPEPGAPDEPIEARLRADAELARASGTPPPFEPLLERALARSPRRARITWLGAAVIVVLGAASAVGAVLATGPSGTPAGRELLTTNDVGFSGAVLDPDDPRRLELVIVRPCPLRDPRVEVVRQTATSVTVRVGGKVPAPSNAPAPGGTGWFAYAPLALCPDSAPQLVPVELAAPLGDRTLYNGTDRQPQPVLDPRTVPTPSYVPPGYRAEPVTWEPGYVSGGAAGSNPATWPATRRYRDGADLLVVRVGRYVSGPGRQVGTATVSGHRASVTDDGGGLCVTWTVRGASWSDPARRAVQVCAGTPPHPEAGASGVITAPATSPLDERALLRVARSLT